MVGDVRMLFDELFQNGNQIIVTADGLAGGIDHFSLNLAGQVVHDQLGGEASTVLIRNLVIVAVDHVIVVVDHGLGDHHRLLAVGQQDGLGRVGDGITGDGFCNAVLHFNQNVTPLIQGFQNLLEFVNGDEVLVILAAELLIGKGPGGISNQNLEGQVGDGAGVIVRDQGVLCLPVGRQLHGDLGMLGNVAAVSFQLGNGCVIIITGSQQSSFFQNGLSFQCQTLFLIHHGFGSFVTVLVVADKVAHGTGAGTNQEKQNQNSGCADDQQRQNLVLELTALADRLFAGACGLSLGCRSFRSGTLLQGIPGGQLNGLPLPALPDRGFILCFGKIFHGEIFFRIILIRIFFAQSQIVIFHHLLDGTAVAHVDKLVIKAIFHSRLLGNCGFFHSGSGFRLCSGFFLQRVFLGVVVKIILIFSIEQFGFLSEVGLQNSSQVKVIVQLFGFVLVLEIKAVFLLEIKVQIEFVLFHILSHLYGKLKDIILALVTKSKCIR